MLRIKPRNILVTTLASLVLACAVSTPGISVAEQIPGPSDLQRLFFPGSTPSGETPSPIKHTSAPAKKKAVEWFKRGKILTLTNTDISSKAAIQGKIMAYISERLFPNPDVKTLNAIRHTLKTQSFNPAYTVKTITSPTAGVIVVSKDVLNSEAKKLLEAVSHDATHYKIGAVNLTGMSDTRLAPVLLSTVKPGSALNARELSDNLYALTQVPGIARVDSLITAGSALDTDNVTLHVLQTPLYSGSQIEVDNYGYAPTGAVTANITGVLNGVISGGDQAFTQVSYAGGMVSGQFGYSRFISPYSRYGVDGNLMAYSVGGGIAPMGTYASTQAFAALGVAGDNYGADAWYSHYFKNTPSEKGFVKVTGYDHEYTDTYSSSVQNTRSVPGASLEGLYSKQWGRWGLSLDAVYSAYYLMQGLGSSNLNPFYYDTTGFRSYLTSNDALSYDLTHGFGATLSTSIQQELGGGALDPMLQATLGGMGNLAALPAAALFGDNMYYGQFAVSYTKSFDDNLATVTPSVFFGLGQVVGIGTVYSAAGPGIGAKGTYKDLFASITGSAPVGALPVAVMGNSIPALNGSNINQGQLPLQLWLSAGIHF